MAAYRSVPAIAHDGLRVPASMLVWPLRQFADRLVEGDQCLQRTIHFVSGLSFVHSHANVIVAYTNQTPIACWRTSVFVGRLV